MSTLESIIWHVLGYSAIPIIFLAGIFAASLIYFVLLRLTGCDNDE
jgi:uncharacterized protein (TIGR02808 family)